MGADEPLSVKSGDDHPQATSTSGVEDENMIQQQADPKSQQRPLSIREEYELSLRQETEEYQATNRELERSIEQASTPLSHRIQNTLDAP